MLYVVIHLDIYVHTPICRYFQRVKQSTTYYACTVTVTVAVAVAVAGAVTVAVAVAVAVAVTVLHSTALHCTAM